MWAIAAIALALALVIVVAVHSRRDATRVDRIVQVLRASGDDRLRPATIDQAIDRLSDSTAPMDIEPAIDPLRVGLDEVPIGAVIADADGQIIVRNRVAVPYASGRHGDALVESAIRSCMRDALLGRSTVEELRLHGPRERVLHIVGTSLIVEGEVIGAIVLVDDVSEQHHADAVRRDFVANVSHELRTPVGALSLLAETLTGEDDPEVVGRFLERIGAETTRLANLIDDLLDLGRIEAGIIEPAAVVDLGFVLREAAEAVREAAASKQITISLEIGDQAVSVSGDHGQLVSAVTNLFENAVKYSADGQTVIGRLVAHRLEAAIAIVDAGIGIPGKDLNRVFERFYRVDRGRASESGGTGLGLSIVRHVAVNHGGRVEVVSREGVGSTFTLIFPMEIFNADREVA